MNRKYTINTKVKKGVVTPILKLKLSKETLIQVIIKISGTTCNKMIVKNVNMAFYRRKKDAVQLGYVDLLYFGDNSILYIDTIIKNNVVSIVACPGEDLFIAGFIDVIVYYGDVC